MICQFALSGPGLSQPALQIRAIPDEILTVSRRSLAPIFLGWA
jgi:hypothetical protein